MGITSLMVDGGVLDKAITDVDGHGVAGDEGVNATTLVTKFLTNEGDRKTELRPPLFLVSLVFAIGVIE